MILKAEEYIKQQYNVTEVNHVALSGESCAKIMIEFAKFHVEAALKAASQKLSSFRASAYKEIIKDSYLLENIK